MFNCGSAVASISFDYNKLHNYFLSDLLKKITFNVPLNMVIKITGLLACKTWKKFRFLLYFLQVFNLRQICFL